VLFATHATESVERLCDRAVIMSAGRVLRVADRAAWGGDGAALSPLERLYVDATRRQASAGRVA
jgi:ABC-type Na+ transport system ATPase subunit NatA